MNSPRLSTTGLEGAHTSRRHRHTHHIDQFLKNHLNDDCYSATPLHCYNATLLHCNQVCRSTNRFIVGPTITSETSQYRASESHPVNIDRSTIVRLCLLMILHEESVLSIENQDVSHRYQRFLYVASGDPGRSEDQFKALFPPTGITVGLVWSSVDLSTDTWSLCPSW